MKPNAPAKCGTHCWHNTGVVLTSYPPQTEEVCCECGERRYVRAALVTELKTHGPFYPNLYRTNPTPLDIETPLVKGAGE